MSGREVTVHKVGLIARHEYLKNVRRRSFLLTTFGMPLLIVAVVAISIVAAETGGGDASTLGYVDQSGVLATPVANPGFRSFATIEQATEALQNKEIRGFYILYPDYAASGRAELLYWDRPPGSAVLEDFDAFLKANLVRTLPPQVAARVLAGPDNVVVRALDGSAQNASPALIGLLLPFALGLFICFALMSAAAYLLRAVTDEKENRTIEIITTSVSPNELIVGKSVGLVGVALTEVLLWAVVALATLGVASRFTEALSRFSVPWSLILVLAAFFVPLFVFAATLMVTLGVVVADTRQGQQLVGGLNLLFLLPLFFAPLLGSSPDGPAMVVLTLFPTTSLLAVAMRWSATVIPLWQLISSWLILAACAGIGLWAAPRVFRQGMLHYGKRMSLSSLAGALRARG